MPGHFGNDVGVFTQEIDQRGIRLTHKIRIMGAFLPDSATDLPDADLTPDSDVLPVLAHNAHALFHQLIAGGDKRRQIVSTA